MARRHSAGILLFRRTPCGIQVLLGHMGGPLWARRNEGAWTLPKGEPDEGEALVDAARREFTEELGVPFPPGELLPLGEVLQRGGKVVTAWALEADLDPVTVTPGTFQMQWPPRSERLQEFPELDRVAWFSLGAAARVMVAAQRQLLTRLPQA